MNLDSGSRRGSPLGCVILCLATLPAGLGAIGTWGMVRWYMLPEPKRVDSFLHLFLACSAIGYLSAFALARHAVKLLRRTGWKSYDPDKPGSHL